MIKQPGLQAGEWPVALVLQAVLPDCGSKRRLIGITLFQDRCIPVLSRTSREVSPFSLKKRNTGQRSRSSGVRSSRVRELFRIAAGNPVGMELRGLLRGETLRKPVSVPAQSAE